jgi:hypothetical protein
MSKFLDLVYATHPLLKEEDETNIDKVDEPLPTSSKEDSALPSPKDKSTEVQLVGLAKTALFIDKSHLEESNPSARTIINRISQIDPIDITNVDQVQKLLEELIALVEMPS